MIERPYQTGRSDFRTYIYSVARNGISSFLHHSKKEILSDKVRTKPYYEPKDFYAKIPGFNSEFNEIFPGKENFMKEIVKSLVVGGEFHDDIWENLSLENQNYSRVILWKLLVRETV
ncbi:unnamed protein product [marine sediment metagenome]|uniref:Uncharacterized protein n=1 Tax=marine sediment metagenome TaxID=412755 RepID=X1T0X3_9ZZZZ